MDVASPLPSEEEFTQAVDEALTPSSPVKRSDMLKGRSDQLQQIGQTLNTRGRSVFIFGPRGVGKTSLAQTAVSLFGVEGRPVIVSCDGKQTTFRLAKEIAEALLDYDPLFAAPERKVSINLGVFSGESKLSTQTVPEPSSINEAAKIIESVLRHAGVSFESDTAPLVLIDEFDRLGSTEERHLVGDFLKQMGDRGLPVRFILCGVGRSLDELFEGHGSAFRYVASVGLDPLPLQARVDILKAAETRVGVNFLPDQQFRIAAISDGFPYYVHLLGETVLKAHFERCREFESKGWKSGFGLVTTDDFNVGIDRAVTQCHGYLKAIYNKATKKYAPQVAAESVTEYEVILWAAAAQSNFELPANAIFHEYERLRQILETRTSSFIDEDEADASDDSDEGEVADSDARRKFNTRISSLRKPTHGSILTRPRRAWWEFTEPMMRGYCRLVAKRFGLDLGGEIRSS